jgi:hypothetical protein
LASLLANLHNALQWKMHSSLIFQDFENSQHKHFKTNIYNTQAIEMYCVENQLCVELVAFQEAKGPET